MIKITKMDIETLSNKAITISRTTQLIITTTIDVTTPDLDGKGITVSIDNVAKIAINISTITLVTTTINKMARTRTASKEN